MVQTANLPRHPRYYHYDRANLSLPDYARLAARFDFDEAGNFSDPDMGTVFEYTSRNTYNKRCWWFVEKYATFCRVTGPVPDEEFEVIEAEYRPEMYRSF
jgi:CCR4-NOT transcriptional regulation complex NOT5 subunit